MLPGRPRTWAKVAFTWGPLALEVLVAVVSASVHSGLSSLGPELSTPRACRGWVSKGSGCSWGQQ